MDFQHKVVLVTGAAAGIGRLTAELFVQAGAVVCLSDVNETDGQALADRLNEQGGKALFVRCDVSRAEEVKNMVDACVATFGRLNICINNAGISGNTLKTPVHLYDEATWDQVLNINAKGVFLCLKYQMPYLMAQQGGAVVNVASVAGLTAVPGNIAYAASKHAVVGMTRTAALEYVRYGIRVNAVCPAFTDTAMVQDSIMHEPEYGNRLIQANPMRRLATVREIADVILFLCSDQASFITGQCLPIDGGLLAL